MRIVLDIKKAQRKLRHLRRWRRGKSDPNKRTRPGQFQARKQREAERKGRLDPQVANAIEEAVRLPSIAGALRRLARAERMKRR